MAGLLTTTTTERNSFRRLRKNVSVRMSTTKREYDTVRTGKRERKFDNREKE